MRNVEQHTLNVQKLPLHRELKFSVAVGRMTKKSFIHTYALIVIFFKTMSSCTHYLMKAKTHMTLFYK